MKLKMSHCVCVSEFCSALRLTKNYARWRRQQKFKNKFKNQNRSFYFLNKYFHKNVRARKDKMIFLTNN